jgi:mannose-6-phosphate isomerase-like protein (cupin superfamily)
MQILINSLWLAEKEEQASLFSMLPVPLDNVPYHNNTEAITRYFAANFPVHLAVHEVSEVSAAPPDYTQPHVHYDSDEINIIISTEKLVYKILLGTNEYTVGSNSSVWIPRGMLHSANVLKGSGFFITIRLK